jgi:hypothetical protein
VKAIAAAFHVAGPRYGYAAAHQVALAVLAKKLAAGVRVCQLFARARRYVFHYDEVAEAEAQGLPYVLAPRVLSRREWMERYAKQSHSMGRDSTRIALIDAVLSLRRAR